MPGFGILFREQLTQRFGLASLRANIRQRAHGWSMRLSIWIVAVLGIACVEGFYIWLLYWFAKMLSAAGLSRLLLFAGLSVTLLSTLVMGTVMLLSVLYFNKAAEALSALPIPYRTVFSVKVTLAYLSECAVSIPLIWPVFIIYGMFEKVGAAFYIKALAVWLCELSLPMLLSALAALPLMRWTALWKRRDLIAIYGGIGLLIAYMAGQMWLSSRITDLFTADLLLQVIMRRIDLFDKISGAIPPLGFAMSALTKTGAPSFWNLAGLIGMSLALAAAAFLLSGRIYKAGVLAQMETHQAGRAVPWERNRFRAATPVKAILLREIRVLFRTPIYAVNTLAGLAVFPILFLMPLIGSASMMNDPQMKALMAFMTSFTDKWMVALVTAGAFTLFGAINPAVSTAVSREGKQYFWSKVVPVPYETQALGKLLVGVLYAWIVSALLAVSLVAGMNLPIGPVAAGLALSLPLAVPCAVMQLSVDLLRPKLNWSNPTEAIKQNMNVMLGMLASMLYIALLFGLVILMRFLKATSGWTFAALCAVAAASCAWSLALLRGAARSGYGRIEA